jgi:hypothetical protein
VLVLAELELSPARAAETPSRYILLTTLKHSAAESEAVMAEVARLVETVLTVVVAAVDTLTRLQRHSQQTAGTVEMDSQNSRILTRP